MPRSLRAASSISSAIRAGPSGGSWNARLILIRRVGSNNAAIVSILQMILVRRFFPAPDGRVVETAWPRIEPLDHVDAYQSGATAVLPKLHSARNDLPARLRSSARRSTP